jgi:hypothetical protein
MRRDVLPGPAPLSTTPDEVITCGIEAGGGSEGELGASAA